jgi:hypothetical protein
MRNKIHVTPLLALFKAAAAWPHGLSFYKHYPLENGVDIGVPAMPVAR